MKSIFVSILLCLFCLQTAHAVSISDSTTSSAGNRSTYTSLVATKTIDTKGFQNSLGMPVGFIIAWPTGSGIKTPDASKWLECNGQSILAADYRDLELVLGSSGGYITIPNLNNRFLRGTTDIDNVLKTHEDTIATYHSKIVNPNVTSSLYKRDVESNLRSRFVKASLDNTSVTTNKKDIYKEITVSGRASGQSYTTKKSTWSVTGTIPEHSFNLDSISLSGSGSVDFYKKRFISTIIHSTNKGDNKQSGRYAPSISYINRTDTRTLSMQGTVAGNTKNVGLTDDSITKGKITVNLAAPKIEGQSDSDMTIPKLSGTINNTKSSGYLDSGFARGSVTNGAIHGEIDSTEVKYTGSKNTYTKLDETAPDHILVRYLIKVAY